MARLLIGTLRLWPPLCRHRTMWQFDAHACSHLPLPVCTTHLVCLHLAQVLVRRFKLSATHAAAGGGLVLDSPGDKGMAGQQGAC